MLPPTLLELSRIRPIPVTKLHLSLWPPNFRNFVDSRIQLRPSNSRVSSTIYLVRFFLPVLDLLTMEGGAAVSAEKSADSASYTYWVREASRDAAPLPVPKKIDPADLCNEPTQSHLGSAWNRVCILGEKESFFFPCAFLCCSIELTLVL